MNGPRLKIQQQTNHRTELCEAVVLLCIPGQVRRGIISYFLYGYITITIVVSLKSSIIALSAMTISCDTPALYHSISLAPIVKLSLR